MDHCRICHEEIPADEFKFVAVPPPDAFGTFVHTHCYGHIDQSQFRRINLMTPDDMTPLQQDLVCRGKPSEENFKIPAEILEREATALVRRMLREIVPAHQKGDHNGAAARGTVIKSLAKLGISLDVSGDSRKAVHSADPYRHLCPEDSGTLR